MRIATFKFTEGSKDIMASFLGHSSELRDLETSLFDRFDRIATDLSRDSYPCDL